DTSEPAPMAQPTLVPGPLHQDAPHRLGGGGEEVAAILPGRAVAVADQPEVRLVDQGRRLESLPRRLADELGLGEPAPLLIDDGQQLAGPLRLTPADRLQKLSHLAHRRRPPPEGLPRASPHCPPTSMSRSVGRRGEYGRWRGGRPRSLGIQSGQLVRSRSLSL